MNVGLTKLSSNNYNYVIVRDCVLETPGVTIILTQEFSNKQKKFFLAGEWSNVDSLFNHMNSLTDDLCGQWFNERQPKKKDKKNA
jgi:hypothetical protein